MTATSKKWYDRKFFVNLLLVVFFPVGLYALWKSNVIAMWWKVTASILVAVFVIATFSDDKQSKTNAVANVNSENTTEVAQASNAPSEETKVQEAKIGDQVQVGNFIYKVDKISFKKTIGDEFSKVTADGIFLLVNLSIKNISNESRTLDNSLFKLQDLHGVEFESSTEATGTIEMSGGKTLFLKQCQPQIQTKGVLVFEVPDKKDYDILLSGGFWEGDIAKVHLKE